MKNLIFILLVFISFTTVQGQTSNEYQYPPDLLKEIEKINLTQDWSAVIVLDTLEVKVRMTKAGVDQAMYLFYPDKHIPMENPHWETFFPVFRQLCSEDEAKRLVWAFNQLEKFKL